MSDDVHARRLALALGALERVLADIDDLGLGDESPAVLHACAARKAVDLLSRHAVPSNDTGQSRESGTMLRTPRRKVHVEAIEDGADPGGNQ